MIKRKRRMPDTELILNRILFMIAKDVSSCEKIQIQKKSRWTALDSETASKLVNYARALKGIIEVQGSQTKRVKKLTDSELNKAIIEIFEAEKAQEATKSKV